MFTSLVLINNIYHRQLRTIYDSIHIIYVILISFYYYLHLSLYYFIFFIIFMLMSNWYMIDTFVSNLGTATVFFCYLYINVLY